MTSENPTPNEPFVPGQPYQPPTQPDQSYQAPGQPYQAPGQFAAAPGYGTPGQVPGMPYQEAPQLASWGTRFLGGLVDYVAPSLAIGLISFPFAPKFDVSTGVTTGGGIIYNLLEFILFAWTMYNSGYLQGVTGQSYGKRIAKTRLIGEATGQPVGALLSIVRYFAHTIDAVICGIGFLFPLWDGKKQTIADKIMKTVVVMDQPR